MYVCPSCDTPRHWTVLTGPLDAANVRPFIQAHLGTRLSSGSTPPSLIRCSAAVRSLPVQAPRDRRCDPGVSPCFAARPEGVGEAAACRIRAP